MLRPIANLYPQNVPTNTTPDLFMVSDVLTQSSSTLPTSISNQPSKPTTSTFLPLAEIQDASQATVETKPRYYPQDVAEDTSSFPHLETQYASPSNIDDDAALLTFK